MNTTISINRTFRVYECFDSYPGIVIALSSVFVELFILIPLHLWTLFLCFRKLHQGKGIPASDLFTVVLSIMEVFSCFGFLMCIISLNFNVPWIMYGAVFMLGKYLIGRPVMNCLICLERFIAVVYPVLFHKFSTLRLRYVCATAAWIITWSFAAHAIFSFPQIPMRVYSIFLTVMLLCITACSLGVLKALLRPVPSSKESQEVRKKKKRVFWVITSILVQLFGPYAFLLVVAMLKTRIPYDTFCLWGGISMWFLRPSSAIQPYLYLSKYNKLCCVKKH